MVIKMKRTLETDRLVLRPFNLLDAKEMYDTWTSDNRVTKYVRWSTHKNLGETQEFLNKYISDTNELKWAISLKETKKLIGSIDVVKITDYKTAEIGYVIAYDFWNKGYTTEALNKIISTLFDLGFKKIIARHHIENLASGAVMKKCGMVYTHNEDGPAKYGETKLVETMC